MLPWVRCASANSSVRAADPPRHRLIYAVRARDYSDRDRADRLCSVKSWGRMDNLTLIAQRAKRRGVAIGATQTVSSAPP